jgi:hypothetical protein
VKHIAATGIAAHRLLGRVAEWWKDELRVKQVPHEDLLRMRFLMLLAEGVIPPPSDGLPSAFPLSYQQSPVKLRIHWNQKKPGALSPAELQALLQAIQLLRIVLILRQQLAQDGINTMHPNFLWLRHLSLLEAPAEKTPAKPKVLILHLRYAGRAWQH